MEQVDKEEPHVLLVKNIDGELVFCDEFPNLQEALHAKLNPPMFTNSDNYIIEDKKTWLQRRHHG